VIRELEAQHKVARRSRRRRRVPNLAAQAIRAGLVDEYHLLVGTMMRGGGKRVLPSDVCVKLDLLDERRFANGMVHLRYHTRA
jgi:riboflavin biosynthesis pyrimidine reductase